MNEVVMDVQEMRPEICLPARWWGWANAKGQGDVLVIEDDVHIAELIAEVLRDERYDVCTARSADAALAAVKLQSPNLVLLDLVLLQVNGVDFLEHLHDGGASFPVVVMTTDRRQLRAIARRLVVDCIEKPFAIDDLLACIARHMAPTILM
jgi:DNA-binding NtrC family response regulator